jgi:Trypsin
MKTWLSSCALLCATLPTWALVGGSIDPNSAASPWAGVGAVVINGDTFSGVLIDDQHVLTAAHVVAGSAPGQVSFVLNAGTQQNLPVSGISLFPGYQGTTPAPNALVWHDDLAVLTLGAPVAGVAPYALYTGDMAGATLTLVGYGRGGDGANGVPSPSVPDVKRTGVNRVDDVLDDDDGGGHAEIFFFDFDGPTAENNVFGPALAPNLTLGVGIEAHFAGGDSGSPAFVNDQGVWKVAGIATFNGSLVDLPGGNVLFGAVGGGTIVAPYADWIASITAPVPEAQGWLMLLAGLGLLGLRARPAAAAA